MMKAKRWCMMQYSDSGYVPLVFKHEVDEDFIHHMADMRGWTLGTYKVWPETTMEHPAIREALVTVAGDPSVGIASSYFKVECHIDGGLLFPEERRTQIEVFRMRLVRAFEDILGERPVVAFDIEMEP